MRETARKLFPQNEQPSSHKDDDKTSSSTAAKRSIIMPRTPAKKAKKAAASHPPYATMVQEAIKDLKDRTGSSTVAIAKWVESKYTLPDTFKKSLSTALKKMTEDGKLVKVKASYKLGAALKAAPKKKVVKKKPATKVTKKPATKVTKKKVVKKKPKKVVKKKPKKAAPKKKTTAPKKKIVKKKK